jgi:thiamine pyrophosphokinase
MAVRAVIFANGEIKDAESLKSILREDDILIAADGGLHHLMALGLWPSILVGDLDSVHPEEIEAVKNRGGQILKYPFDKNETDLQLAIDHALQLGCKDITVAGALGGRTDQTLGNIFLLSRPNLEGVSMRLDDGREEIFLIRSSAEIYGSPGDIVSLLPLKGPVFDVRTENLKYPLVDEILFPDKTRGISNIMLTEHARVSISRGVLICIHSRQ